MCNLLNTVFSSKEPFIGWNFTLYASTQEVKISKSDNQKSHYYGIIIISNSLSISPIAGIFPLEQNRQSEKDAQQLNGFSFKWKQINQVNPEDTGSFS